MRRSMVVLCVALFLLVCGTGIVAPLLAPYAKGLGATGLWIGWLYSGFYCVRIVLGTPLGRLGDRFGPRAMLICSLMLYPFVALAYWFASHLYGLVGARLLHGATSAMMLPMAMTYMGLISPRGREGEYLGLYNTVLFLANGCGPIIGGVVAAQWGIPATFLALLGLSILSLLLTGVALPPVRVVPPYTGKTSQARVEPPTAAFAPWRHWGILAIAPIHLVVAALSIFICSFFPLYGASCGLSTFHIGMLIGLHNFSIGLSQFYFGRWADRGHRFFLIVCSLLCTAIAIALFAVTTNILLLALLMIVSGLTAAVALAAVSALSAILGREVGMGHAMGFFGSAYSAGMIIGPLVSGWLADRFTVSITFYFMAGLWSTTALLFVGLWTLYRRQVALRIDPHVIPHQAI